MKCFRRLIMLSVAALGLTAEGAVIHVTTTSDVIAPGNPVSLREAIIEANNAAGSDTIVLPAGTYSLSIPGTSENLSTSGDLDVTDDLIIEGEGAHNTIINGSGLDRVFHLVGSTKTLTLRDLTIKNGSAPSNQDGGGILNEGSLMLERCIVANNRVLDQSVIGQAGNDGGGIYSSRSLTILSSSILSNNAASALDSTGFPGFGGRGGGVYATGLLIVSNSTFAFNTSGSSGDNTAGAFNGANGGNGGAIFSSGTNSIVNSTFSQNATGSGGNSFAQQGGVGGAGGAIYTTATGIMAHCTIVFNTVGASGTGPLGSFGTGNGGGLFSGPSMSVSHLLAQNNTTPAVSDTAGSFFSLGYNFIFTPGSTIISGDTNNTFSTLAAVGPLEQFNDYLWTRAITNGPTVDAGDPSFGTNPLTDQRGFARISGDRIDIGAYEFYNNIFSNVLTVGTTDDTFLGFYSLRECIDLANAGSGDVTIHVPPGVYTITRDGIPETGNLRGDFNISAPGRLITIVGEGPEQSIIDGNALDNVFGIASSTFVCLEELTVRNGLQSAGNNGGGISSFGILTVKNCTIENNRITDSPISATTPGVGGGIYSFGSINTLTIIDSTIRSNQSASAADSAGIPKSGGGGGGIYTDSKLVISNSTFHANRTGNAGNSTGASALNGGFGGGLYAAGPYRIVNSTFSGNITGSGGSSSGKTVSGGQGGLGGGLYLAATGTIVHCTIVENRMGPFGTGDSGPFVSLPGGGISAAALCDIGHTLLQSNVLLSGSTLNDGAGTLNSLDYNLIHSAGNFTLNGATNNTIIGQFTALGALADNGGSTPTHALPAGALAVDAGGTNYPGAPAADQRGEDRDNFGFIDIGAFELQQIYNYSAWAAGIVSGFTNFNESATGDGYPNLLKYVTGSDAVTPDDLARLRIEAGGAEPALRFNRNINATDAIIYVETAETVGDNTMWIGVATNTAGSWGGSPVVSEGPGNPAAVTVDAPEVTETSRVWRLRVTLP